MKMAGAPCPSGLKGDPNTAQGKERSDAALGIARMSRYSPNA